MHAGKASCAWAGVIVVDRRFTRAIAVADLFPQYETRESRCSRNAPSLLSVNRRYNSRQTEVALDWPVIRRCREAPGQKQHCFCRGSCSNSKKGKEPEIISFILWSRGMTF
jgi:hypothetical protein